MENAHTGLLMTVRQADSPPDSASSR